MLNKHRSIEVEGASTEEAIQRGLKILGVDRNKTKIKIISEEDKGLFGMDGVRKAKVRIFLKE